MSVPSVSWQHRAACRRPGDRELFFGPFGETTEDREDRERVAKALCVLCPVKRECLTLAVVAGIRWGVWGNTGERERALIRRRWLRRQQNTNRRTAA